MTRFLAVVISGLCLVAFTSTASAQYIPPEENLIPEGPTSCTVNCTTVVACVLVDSAGVPIPNESITFTLVRGPLGATLLTTSGTTDTNGRATASVYVGSETGIVEVTCESAEAEATYTGQVLGSQFVPPTTGDAGLVGTSSGHGFLLAALAISPIVAYRAARFLRQ